MDDDEKPSLTAAFEHYGIDILGRDVGGWRKCQCPIPAHEDTNPSASMNEEACRWRCHTCDRGGDIYDLIMEVEGLAGFPVAKRRAVELFGDGDGSVSRGGGGSSLLPRRSGNRSRGSVRPAPWTRL